MSNMVRIFVCSLVLLGAGAAEAGVVADQVVEKEIVVRDGHGADAIARVRADKVEPGEEVIYTLRYRNDGAAAAEGIVLVMPVPAEITYVEGSVAGAGARLTFSANGGATYVARGRLTVTEDGRARPANGDDITHIKWAFDAPVAPGAAGAVSYRGVLQ